MLCDKNSNIRTCDDYFYTFTRERPAMRRGPAGLHHMSTVPRRAAALHDVIVTCAAAANL